jgi:predicted acyl esterase
VSYDSESVTDLADFTFTFKEKTRMIGLPKAVLYVSCEQKDDLVVFVILRKRDQSGKLLMHLTFPFKATPYKSIDDIPKKEQASLNLHMGSLGILRASHRAYDAERSIHPQFPFHPHEIEEKITPGDIVKLEIGIWAMGNDFEAGESISVQVCGQLPSIAEFTAFSAPRPEHEKNKGTHRIHCGPEHPSSIILPVVPL